MVNELRDVRPTLPKLERERRAYPFLLQIYRVHRRWMTSDYDKIQKVLAYFGLSCGPADPADLFPILLDLCGVDLTARQRQRYLGALSHASDHRVPIKNLIAFIKETGGIKQAAAQKRCPRIKFRERAHGGSFASCEGWGPRSCPLTGNFDPGLLGHLKRQPFVSYTDYSAPNSPGHPQATLSDRP
jgi:hypothetical protein